MKRKFLIGATVVAVVIGTFALVDAQQGNTQQQQRRPAVTNAVAVIMPTDGSQVRGVVRFTQGEDGVKVVAEIAGLEPNSSHGFHIHEFGDMTAGNGTGMGGHYNPMESEHALPEKEMRHAGDLGNVKADGNGVAKVERTIEGFTLSRRNAVVGRGVVIHEKADDGGQPTGNAGGRIGYGVIGIAKSE